MEKPQETWLCPLCGLVRMKYGTTCPHFKDGTCENIDKVHLTGQYYLREQLKSGKSIGISEIMNDG